MVWLLITLWGEGHGVLIDITQKEPGAEVPQLVTGPKWAVGLSPNPLASASLPSIPLGEESKVQKSRHCCPGSTGQLQDAGGWH